MAEAGDKPEREPDSKSRPEPASETKPAPEPRELLFLTSPDASDEQLDEIADALFDEMLRRGRSEGR